MKKPYAVFYEEPYEGYGIREFDTLKEARDYAKSLIGDPDVMDIRLVKLLSI